MFSQSVAILENQHNLDIDVPTAGISLFVGVADLLLPTLLEVVSEYPANLIASLEQPKRLWSGHPIHLMEAQLPERAHLRCCVTQRNPRGGLQGVF